MHGASGPAVVQNQPPGTAEVGGCEYLLLCKVETEFCKMQIRRGSDLVKV